MTSTSRVPAVITYLLSTFTAAATLGAANPPVRILDGPVVSAETPPLTLWVGLDDPDDLAAQQAAESEQTWAGLGAMAKDEDLRILCVAEAWSGEDPLAAVRASAYGIVAAVENLIRANANLGGNVLFGAVIPTGLLQASNDRGALARVPFRIEAKARI